MKVKTATVSSETAVSYRFRQNVYFVSLSEMAQTYDYERPGSAPMIMCQVPDEEQHDRADNETGDQLRKSEEVEGDSRVVRRRSLRSAITPEHSGGIAIGKGGPESKSNAFSR